MILPHGKQRNSALIYTPPLSLLTVVGARPQFVKAAMVSRAVLAHNRRRDSPEEAAASPRRRIVEEIVHTGQHYDPMMSRIFFDEMGIPVPAVNLEIGSASHGAMTGRMLERIETELMDRKPDVVLVYGDTNSTLAAALAAVKLHIPVAHVEAGLRSNNRRMPEEINRVLTDHVSRWLFCPTRAAVENLATEGVVGDDVVFHTGDVMFDAARIFGEVARRKSKALENLELEAGQFALATCHRAENTDSPQRLGGILHGLCRIAADMPVVFPVHPRTRARLEAAMPNGEPDGLRLIEPISFLDMAMLEQNARVVLTDSGGVQKEAYFHGTPCVTLRDETEWIETVDAGWNQVVGADPDRMVRAVERAAKGSPIEEYGDGDASGKILDILLQAH